MNRKEYSSTATKELVDQSARGSPPPPAFAPLSWIQVIYQPDPDLEEFDGEEALSAASQSDRE